MIPGPPPDTIITLFLIRIFRRAASNVVQWTNLEPDVSGHGSTQVAGHTKMVEPSENVNLRRLVSVVQPG